MSEPYKILIVEDPDSISEIESYVLNHCSGHIARILRIENQSDLLHALDEDNWDILLSDFKLKYFSAEEALRIINRRGLDIPQIVVMDDSIDREGMSVLYAGAEHIISKSEMGRLCITVPRSIANARRRREIARELNAHRSHLEELVATRTADLEKLNEQLQKEIDKRKRVESALRESEGQYRHLVENAHDGICIVQDQKIQFANPTLANMVGYEISEMVGTRALDYNPKEDFERLMTLYRRIIKGEEDLVRTETKLIKKRGQLVDVIMSASAIEFQGRRAVMMVIRDVTEQKRMDRVSLETEKLEAVGVVARGVGNNYANIMSVISSYAVSLADSFLPHTRPHESAHRILEATRHASALTKRLLSVVQISESDSQKAKLETVSLRDAIRSATSLLAHTMQANNIKLMIKKEEALPSVVADKNQLLDTLISIFMNAIDAMPKGGTIAIKAIERRIAKPRSNPHAKGGRFVGLSIHDNGTGMTKEQLAHVFEPFYTTKSSQEAFGLGLPVAQSMALGWGGWLDIRSRKEKGTRVRIFMAKATPVLENQTTTQSKMKVLVVDDNPGRRQMIVSALHNLGHDVLEAFDGDSAIAMYRKHADEIELSIVDWILPGTDGKGVLKAILEKDAQAKVIMISGFSRDYVRSQIRLGAWGFLQKPFSEEELMREINKIFKRVQ